MERILGRSWIDRKHLPVQGVRGYEIKQRADPVEPQAGLRSFAFFLSPSRMHQDLR